MTTVENDVLDELYFVQPYEYLVNTLELSNENLKSTRCSLLEKGWINCYSSPTKEIDFENKEFENDYWNYHYLADKTGLLAHNSNY